MKKNQDQPADAAELRRRAEARLSEKQKSQRSEAGDQRTAEDTARLVHKLQVHQIELEMQNEELKQARAKADELLAQYTDLYDFAPAGYLTLDREGAIRLVNLTGVRLFGVERSQLVKRRLGQFVAEGDRRAFSDFLQKVFASEAKERCEVTLPREGLQPLVVQIKGTRSADGQECRAVVLDVTERKQAEATTRQALAKVEASRKVLLNVVEDQKRTEAALRENEIRYRTLVENAPMAVFVNRADRIVLANEACLRLFGATAPEQLLGKSPFELFHPDFHPVMRERIHQLRDLDQVVPMIEQKIIRLDGTPVDVEITAAPFQDQGVNAIHVVLRDITERKGAVETLRKHSERLQSLYRIDQSILLAVESPEAITQTALLHLRSLLHCQRASVGIFDLEKKKVRVFAAEVNGETMVQTGKDLAEEAYGDLEILRQGRMEMIEDMSRVTSPSAFAQVLQAEGIRSCINVPLISERGLIGGLNVGWEDARAITPEETEIMGELAGQITIAIEQARLLQETKRHAAELEQRVADRTAQLEATNQELEAFSYSVSHDLRAPLRGIDGWAQALLADFGDKLGEPGRQLLHRQRAASQRMGTLIDDLLQLSRLTRQPLTRQTVGPATLVHRAWEELRPAQPPQTAELVVDTLPDCQADASLLTQVFVNLLGNALKFSSGHAHPRIEVGSQSGPDNECVYFVKDNGAGFDMRYANKLFGAFQRLHSTHEFPGTGIGLAITQRIIRRHGGRIWAESAVGQGATFFFTLSEKNEECRMKKAE